MKKINILILLLILFSACAEEGQEKAEKKGEDTTKIVDVKPITKVKEEIKTPIKEGVDAVLTEQFYKHFVGLLKPSLDLVMDITCTGKNKLQGAYYNAEKSAFISLHGKINDNGSFTLKELGGDNGTFSGRYNSGTFSGTWKSKKTAKEIPFELSENYSTSLKFNYYQVNEKYTSEQGGATDFQSFYIPKEDEPEIRKLIGKLHFPKQEMPSNFKNYIKNFKSNFIEYYKKEENENVSAMGWEQSYIADIAYNHDGFLSYAVHYSAFEGGAHGAYSSSYIVIDVKNKKKLELTDIFIAGAEAKLSAMIYKKIQKNREFTDQDMKISFVQNPLPMPQNFYITQAGISFLYNPYEITSYANGSDEVFFKYSELKELLSPVLNPILQ